MSTEQETDAEQPQAALSLEGGTIDFHHSTCRTIGMLFKRLFLMKLRNPVSIIEICIAIVIAIIVYPMAMVCSTSIDAVPAGNPGPITFSNVTDFFTGAAPKLILMPNVDDCPDMGSIEGAFQSAFEETGKTDGVLILYADSIKEMENYVFTDSSNAAGIQWVNCGKENQAIHPEVNMFFQGGQDYASNFLVLVRGAIGYTDPDIKEIVSNQSFVNTYYQAYPEMEKEDFGNLGVIVGIFSLLPIFFATLPDFQVVLGDRESRIFFLFKNLGMTEFEYWLVAFIVPLVISLIPYLILTIIILSLDVLKGTPFFLFFIPCLMFIIAELWLHYFLISFLKDASTGKYMFIVVLILAVVFCDVHTFYTLKEGTPMGIKHFFSIFPFSAFFLFLMGVLNKAVSNQSSLSWSDIKSSNNMYPLWIGYMWLAIDSGAYFLLFTIFNALFPRGFGRPPLTLKELFTGKACKKSDDTRKVAATSDDYVTVSDLTHTYSGRKKPALDDISFTIKENEVIVAIGSNGAGKSTLINILCDGLQGYSGEVSFRDGLEKVRHSMGVVLQDNVLVAELSVKEHIIMFGAIKGITDEIIQQYIEYFGEQLQLTHMMDNRAGDLSGGQKRKLCVALAMIGAPNFVLMDEPTVGVDVQARQLIWKMISAMKCTCLITTHALEEAETVSSRLFVISMGTIPFAGNATQLRQTFKCGYILRLDEGDLQKVLELAQQFVPDSKISDEVSDALLIPINPKVPELLKSLNAQKQAFGIKAYSFSIQNLDDMLTKIGQNDEVHSSMRRNSSVYF